jgi:adenosylcobinamide-GDP ribazoletransferase
VALACTPATPPATTTGLGATVAGTVPVRTGRLLLGSLLVVAVGLSALDGAVAALRAGAAVALSLLAARLLRRHAVRRLGGVTGDVLAAFVEVTTTVALVVLVLG